MNNLLKYLILSATFAASCTSDPAGKDLTEREVLPEDIVELSLEQIKVAGVEFGAFEERTISNTLKVNGLVTVMPQNLASVCAPMGGFIKTTTLVQGSPVKKGQVLAIIENADFIDLQQNYLEAMSKLEFAEGEYKRHKTLYEEDVYSSQNLQEVTANYKSLRAQVTALRQKLALIGIEASGLTEDNISLTVELRSPINGYIKTAEVNLGRYVTPTDVLFEVVNTSEMVLELTLFEKDINQVESGQKLQFALTQDGSQRFSAVITQVGKAIGTDKSVRAYASISGPSGRILPGMYVNAWVENMEDKVLTVPTEAIIQFNEKNYIFIYERDKEEKGIPFTEFRIVEVTRGITMGDFTGIVLPGEFSTKNARLVVKGAYSLMAAKKNAGEMSC
jgi:membrane fusion protein, heavy metal efflux system